jgi:pyruvate dehydrogenase E2 component (dihydrolipoamide acetyltransferase)
VLKDAHTLDLVGIASALDALVATAREGRCTPAQLSGSTVTITNIGVFGVGGGTPIINPGESAILAVGAIADRPWAVDGSLVVRKAATLTLSFDHRVVDGAAGSRALASIARNLQQA